jgi:hypothetical protein
VLADHIDYTVRITSRIRFLDDHFEDGPSTSFATRLENKRGLADAQRLIDNKIGEMTREHFGDGFWNGVRTLIRPRNPDDDAKEMMEIIYTIESDATAYFEDGTSKDLSETQEIRRRLGSNSLW